MEGKKTEEVGETGVMADRKKEKEVGGSKGQEEDNRSC